MATSEDWKVVRAAGVEPTTFGSGGRHSIQLSYARNPLICNHSQASNLISLRAGVCRLHQTKASRFPVAPGSCRNQPQNKSQADTTLAHPSVSSKSVSGRT